MSVISTLKGLRKVTDNVACFGGNPPSRLFCFFGFCRFSRERNFREDGKREAEELGFPKSMTFWAFSVIQIVNKKLEKTSSK